MSHPLDQSSFTSLYRQRSASIIHYGDLLSARSGHLDALHVTDPHTGKLLARYRWRDPSSPTFYRVGIFAGIHGDEESGVVAVIQLLRELQINPDISEFYELFVYPICNPWGFDAGRREGKSGKDLNRCFWRDREEPEVRLLEQELRAKQFDGIISLHTDDTSEGIYGYVNGNTLTRHLLEPALRVTSSIIPRDDRSEIDTHPANDSMIFGGYQGILGAPEEQHPQPFSIVFETPHHAPMGKQVEAHLSAIREILSLFRVISSEGRDI